MTTQQNISDLLAHRDGERLELAVAAHIEDDPGSRARLKRFRELKSQLNELPTVTPSTTAWEAIRRRSAKPKRSLINGVSQYPLATAATVFLVAALSIIAWNPADFAGPGGDAAPAQPSVLAPLPASAQDYAAVLDRSRRLEYLLWQASPNTSVDIDSAQRALVYRLADLDSELGRYPIGERQDSLDRQRMWRQRVELLEALAQTRRARAVVQPAVY